MASERKRDSMGRERIPYAERSDDIVAFVRKYIADHGYSPTMREIGRAVGYESSSNVHTVIQKMIADGVLIGAPHRPRTIRVSETVLPETGTTT